MEDRASVHIERTAEQAKNEKDWLAFISSVTASLSTTPSNSQHSLPDLTNTLLQLQPRVSTASPSSHAPQPLPSGPSHSHQPSPTTSYRLGPDQDPTKGTRSSSVPAMDEFGSGPIASSSAHHQLPSAASTSSSSALSHLMDQISFPPVYDPSLHLHYPTKNNSPPLPATSTSPTSPTDFHPFFPPPSSSTTFSPPVYPSSSHDQPPHHTFPHNPLFHQPASHQVAFHLPPAFTFGSAAPSPLDQLPPSPPQPARRASTTSTSARGRPSRGRSTSSAGRTNTAASSTSGSPPVALNALEDIDGSGSGGAGEDVEEDKRRRNTEASARFRAKKKAKTINLTRTVSDLNGRVQELEVEAGELRNENKWLKQLVLTKAQGGTS